MARALDLGPHFARFAVSDGVKPFISNSLSLILSVVAMLLRRCCREQFRGLLVTAVTLALQAGDDPFSRVVVPFARRNAITFRRLSLHKPPLVILGSYTVRRSRILVGCRRNRLIIETTGLVAFHTRVMLGVTVPTTGTAVAPS